MSGVIAEKELDYYDGGQTTQAFLRVLKPEPDGDSWVCRYQIDWPGYERTFGVMGVDSLQALVLALRVISSAVGSTNDFKAGKIGCFGQRLTTYDELEKLIGLVPTGLQQ